MLSYRNVDVVTRICTAHCFRYGFKTFYIVIIAHTRQYIKLSNGMI